MNESDLRQPPISMNVLGDIKILALCISHLKASIIFFYRNCFAVLDVFWLLIYYLQISSFLRVISFLDFSAFFKFFLKISPFVSSCHFVVGHFVAFTIDICTHFPSVFENFVCFIKTVISTPGAWLSCSSCLDVRTALLLDVL